MTTVDDPAELLEGLGFHRGDGDPAPPALEGVHSAITADLERRQGPWRRMSWLSRLWPTATATALGGWLMFVWPAGGLDGRPLVQLAALAGSLAVLLTIVAATLAPSRPGMAERLTRVGLAGAVLALGAEGALAASSSSAAGFSLQGTLGCGGMMIALTAGPLLLLLFNLWRSGTPGRPLHLIAATAAATAVGGVAIWRHCLADDGLHILLSHVALPALIAPALGLLLYILLDRRTQDSAGYPGPSVK